jgi:hypothetical protein
VTDERRRHGRLSAPPLRGHPEKGTGHVNALVRATSPPFARFLAGALLRAILTVAGSEYGPSGRQTMPAKSKAQQKAAGAALSAKRGDSPKSKLQGASKQMASSMSEKQLEELASTKRKGKPERAGD